MYPYPVKPDIEIRVNKVLQEKEYFKKCLRAKICPNCGSSTSMATCDWGHGSTETTTCTKCKENDEPLVLREEDIRWF